MYRLVRPLTQTVIRGAEEMKGIKNCFRRVKNRPGMFVFLALVTLLTTALEQYNPLTAKYAHFSTFSGLNFVDILCNWSASISAFFGTPRVAFFTIGIGIFLLFALCVALGLIFAGFSNQMSASSFDKPRRRGEYRIGIGRYTFKLALFFFVSFIILALLTLAMLYATIPSIMSVKLFFTGSAGMLIPMIGLCIISAVTVFFAAMFVTLYLTYILPSIIYFRKGGTGVAVRMVNGYCWYLLPRTLLFTIICTGIRVLLWGIHYGLNSTAAARCILVATWLIRTIVYFVYIYFVFDTFAAMKSDMFDSN